MAVGRLGRPFSHVWPVEGGQPPPRATGLPTGLFVGPGASTVGKLTYRHQRHLSLAHGHRAVKTTEELLALVVHLPHKGELIHRTHPGDLDHTAVLRHRGDVVHRAFETALCAATGYAVAIFLTHLPP